MTGKDKVLNIAKHNSGVILASQVKELGISTKYLTELVKEKRIFHIQRGIYITEDGYVDDFFLIQHKFSKGIFSHETALFILGFSDRVPVNFTMTFKQGYSTSPLKRNGIKPVTTSKGYDIGIEEVKRNGMILRVYNIERTLVDLLKPRYNTDNEQFIPALKKYSVYEKRDFNLLLKYAQEFNVEEQIQKYMEVLI